jgi:hypothetical protein
MKISGLLIVILLCAHNSFGQDLSKQQQIDFFNLTIKDYFDSKDSTQNAFYILSDSIPSGIKTDYDKFKIHLIDYNQAYPLIKKDKISSLYWARCKKVSSDTVDIVIGGWSVDFERVLKIQKTDGKRKLVTKNYNFAAWCGGTLGYIPQGRFIYLTELDKWDYITEKTIIDNKLKKYKLK